MMLEASVVGAAPSEFNDDLDHDGKAALIKCFLQAVGIAMICFPIVDHSCNLKLMGRRK